LFPDLPTIGEFYRGYEVTIWLGLFAPAGTPEPIVTALRSEVQKVLAQPELADKLNVTGALQPLLESPQDFATLIKSDYDKYGKLARDIGIKVE
jgi:tripartite-type tricarboxylate transporter receptor subunit TctC